MFKKIKEIIQRRFRRKKIPYRPPRVVWNILQQARINDAIKKSEED